MSNRKSKGSTRRRLTSEQKYDLFPTVRDAREIAEELSRSQHERANCVSLHRLRDDLSQLSPSEREHVDNCSRCQRILVLVACERAKDSDYMPEPPVAPRATPTKASISVHDEYIVTRSVERTISPRKSPLRMGGERVRRAAMIVLMVIFLLSGYFGNDTRRQSKKTEKFTVSFDEGTERQKTTQQKNVDSVASKNKHEKVGRGLQSHEIVRQEKRLPNLRHQDKLHAKEVAQSNTHKKPQPHGKRQSVVKVVPSEGRTMRIIHLSSDHYRESIGNLREGLAQEGGSTMVEVVAEGKGRINYEANVVKAVGVGALPPPTPAHSRTQDALDARHAALANALRTLEMAVSQVRVSSDSRVQNHVVESDEIRLHVRALVQSAQVVEEKYVPATGIFRVVVQINLTGPNSLAEAVGVGNGGKNAILAPEKGAMLYSRRIGRPWPPRFPHPTRSRREAPRPPLPCTQA